jgi:predicted dehydrogenase
MLLATVGRSLARRIALSTAVLALVVLIPNARHPPEAALQNVDGEVLRGLAPAPSRRRGWGIASAGDIAHVFATALHDSGARIVAVAARHESDACELANQYNARCYGGYDALLHDDEVEIIYVATLHITHRDLAVMYLNAGKHVVIEKPMGMNVRQTAEIFDAARGRTNAAGEPLFVTEAYNVVWMPAGQRVLELLRSGAIGQVQAVRGAIWRPGLRKSYPRIFDPLLGGSVLFDTGFYPMAAAFMAFGALGNGSAVDVVATGYLNDKQVDIEGTAVVKFAAGLATVSWQGKDDGPSANEFIIYGSTGRLRFPALTPMMVDVDHGDGKWQRSTFPLPSWPALFMYEARGIERCIAEGRHESPDWRWEQSMGVAKAMEAARRAIGMTYPDTLR